MPIFLAAALLWLGLSGYVVNTNQDLTQPFWSSLPVQFHLWSGFTDKLPQVEDGSLPGPAIRQALQRWTQVSGLSATLSENSAHQNAGEDQVNLITIADTPTNRSLIGTNLAKTFKWIREGSQIVESDIIFNSQRQWSTVEPADRAEAESDNILELAQHEFGHVWNLDHTINRSSAMYFQGGTFGYDRNRLTWDDLAGLQTTLAYRLPGMDQITGRVSGRVTQAGRPIIGAFICALDTTGRLLASALTHSDGTYRVSYLPPGNYAFYVEPLDGPMEPRHLSFGGQWNPDTAFLPRLYLDSAQPRVAVSAGKTTPNINFEVFAGNATLDPAFLGTVDNVNAPFSLFTTPAESTQGARTHFVIGGEGSDRVLRLSEGLTFANPLLQTGAANREGQLTNGDPYTFFPLTVSQEAAIGEYSAFLRNSAQELGVVSGALKLFSPFRFGQIFAHFALVPGSVTSEAFLVNLSSAPITSQGRVRVRDQAGRLRPLDWKNLTPDAEGSGRFEIPSRGTLLIEEGGRAGFTGSLVAEAGSLIGGTVLYRTSFGVTGVAASEELYSFLAPVQLASAGREVNTALAIVNLDKLPALIYVQAQGLNGIARLSRVVELAGGGQTALFLNNPDIPTDSLLPGLPGDFEGTLLVTGNRRLAATVIRTAPGVLTTLPVIQNQVSTETYFAQFAHVPGQLSSELILANPSPVETAREVTVLFRTQDGLPGNLLLEGELLNNGSRRLAIPPLGSVRLRTGGLLPFVGSVRVSSKLPVGGVVLFQSGSMGTTGVGESHPLSEAVLPLERDTASGIDTGIAAVNPESRPVTLLVRIRDGKGILKEEREVILGAGGQFASFLSESALGFPLPAKFRGTVWIQVKEKGLRVAMTVIRQSPGVLTTFPALPPAVFSN